HCRINSHKAIFLCELLGLIENTFLLREHQECGSETYPHKSSATFLNCLWSYVMRDIGGSYRKDRDVLLLCRNCFHYADHRRAIRPNSSVKHQPSVAFAIM